MTPIILTENGIKMNKFDLSIVLNASIIILEILALIICLESMGSIDLTYYTVDSNIFLLVSSILYLIFRKNTPKIVELLKYSSTLSVMITFLVVIFVLLPMYDFNYQFFLLDGPNLYVHVICPILALVSFVFFERNNLENTLRNNLRAVYFTIVYAVIILILNIQKIVTGPYPFLKVYEQSLIMSVFWIVLIMGATFVLAWTLLAVKDLDRILY